MDHSILPLVFRAEEEQAMRACCEGERGCLRGPACYALNLPDGRLPPRFRHWDLCVVCLRADTLARWLDGLGVEPKTGVIQPYYVVIGPGEYSMEACIPIWDGVWDGMSDPFVRFDPPRLRWVDGVLRQLDVEFTAFPKQITLANGLPDIFKELVLCGLLAPRNKTKTPGILNSIQTALWSRSPQLNVASSWIRALHACYGHTDLTTSEAVRCVYEYIVWYTQQNPVVEARLRELHPSWAIFRIWAPCSSKGASHYLSAVQPAAVPQVPAVIPLPCHWVAESQDRETFYCPTCFDFKGFLYDRLKCKKPPKNKSKKKKKPAPMHDQDGNFIRRGSERVSFCNKTGRELCLHVKNTGIFHQNPSDPAGRKSAKSTCIAPLVHVDIFGCAVQVKGKVFIPCFKCGMLHRRLGPTSDGRNGPCEDCGMLHHRSGRCPDCGLCAKRTLAVCIVCNTKRNLTPVLVFEDLGLGEDVKVYVCNTHSPRNLGQYRRWNRYHLMRVITEKMLAEGSKRHGVKVLRT
jgi:hypothetical protein